MYSFFIYILFRLDRERWVCLSLIQSVIKTRDMTTRLTAEGHSFISSWNRDSSLQFRCFFVFFWRKLHVVSTFDPFFPWTVHPWTFLQQNDFCSTSCCFSWIFNIWHGGSACVCFHGVSVAQRLIGLPNTLSGVELKMKIWGGHDVCFGVYTPLKECFTPWLVYVICSLLKWLTFKGLKAHGRQLNLSNLQFLSLLRKIMSIELKR